MLPALQQHLRRCHHLPRAQRLQLLQHCRSLDLITRLGDLQLPLDNSPALPFLPVQNGYSCGQCRRLTCSRKEAHKHANKVHRLTFQACTDSYRPIQLQSWFGGNRTQYWIVRAEAAAVPTAIQQHSSCAEGELDELYRLEQQEIQRLHQLEQDFIAQENELEDSDNSPWLRWTQWPAQFAGLPLDIIAASAVQPEKAPKSDYVLGNWAGEQFVSPVADEVKLQQLVQLLDCMFDCCNHTVEATPHLLRCWLHSTKPERYFPKPFGLPQKLKTQQRYRAFWKQFICFAFRVWATDSDSGLQHEVYGDIQFSQRQ
jgi:Orsellinic acid/F9775 biosynthesis cluster protein D